MVVDDLATLGARASAAVVLTYLSRNVPVSASEWLFFLFDLTIFTSNASASLGTSSNVNAKHHILLQ